MNIDEIKMGVMYMLYEAHFNTSNISDTPISERIIADAFKVDIERVRTTLGNLRDDELIEEVNRADRLFYRITGRGMEEYEQEYATA